MSEQNISFIAHHILKGGVALYPTDTLYALGSSIFDENAVRKVFEIKKRPFTEPLPVAVDSEAKLEEIVFLNDDAKRLIDVFLPGPLTIVLKKKDVPDVVTAGKPTVAVRIPGNDKALKLLSETGPLTVTSANIHGKPVLGGVEEIRRQLGVDLPAIDDGWLSGDPSTIVDLTADKPMVLREGIISKGRIMDVIDDG
ncbi:MAG TPA: threonylcarbamoyl-AMP synthase [Thermoplasmatales archaeon]|nr:threonylcarbamoyl-AMP synthase [Thermoplasmatales archaeon]